MARNKIDYGIDLGTTNSAISRIEEGKPIIIKTDTLKDTMPSCVFFNKKRSIQIGDSAYSALKRDKLKASRNPNVMASNAFIEFKRTMGTDKKYYSESMGQEYSSEQLSAEVLKTLKSFVSDEDVKAVVVTVPAKFTSNQKDATLRAAKLAGISQCELLQEPIAAAMSYGLSSSIKDGQVLVFDFGGGTFDAALVEVHEGIMKVIDTEGDNYLGGKNLDLAIVDRIILPHLQDEYDLDEFLSNEANKVALQAAMKFYAEEAKIQMSFSDSHNILSDLGDIPCEDDNGEELELDITVTQEMMEHAVGPVFQKAIDVCKALLERNNLSTKSLNTLLLVGGPTYSPVLRKMLEEQLIKPNLSVDPMTVVANGAALFASTVDIADDLQEAQRDRTKIQLSLSYEATTVEEEEFVAVKVLEDRIDGEVPEQVYIEFTNSDRSWSTGKKLVGKSGEVIDVTLKADSANLFTVSVSDGQGSKLDCEPESFTIIQGSKIGSATLPYHYGVEIKSRDSGKIVFDPIKGLEKNQSTPAVGTKNGLKTQKPIRPGVVDDSLKIALYQGEHNAKGTRALHNEHVYDVVITGEHLPKLLPEGSDVELTVKIDKSERMTVSAYFPSLDYTHEIDVPTNTTQSEIDSDYLSSEINKAIQSHKIVCEEGVYQNYEELDALKTELNSIKEEFELGKSDYDRKMGVLHRLRSAIKKIEKIQDESEWPKVEDELKSVFYQLEQTNNEFDNQNAKPLISQYKDQIPEAIRDKDITLARELIDNMRRLNFAITDEGLGAKMEIGLLYNFNDEFDMLQWSDSHRARNLIDKGLQLATDSPSKERLRPIVSELYSLLPHADKTMLSEGDGSELIG
ncbi:MULTISPECIES: Hsp70 family protein [Gammaproteobacteria]|uniref:Hsp70 family protein n=1 Tax=Gammaproteobacteria TaxID=1236 RepID=UPI000DD0B1CB|nr:MULTISPECIES: Hsp70 family protein [Gammaproteobacteria]RTE85515.1 Hsp70 family protein [Aliidiomarina sp. B3213]TCZ89485.1 Hsp70 family protein [Lysobacter sp. N42]